MKTHPFALAVACATALLTPHIAGAFSISAVSLSPSNVVPPMTELRLTIDIITPSQGTWLYAPTQISSNAAGLRVDVFPTSGPLTAIGSLRETVTLGTFPVGSCNYEVVIHPNFQVNWGTRTNRGSFTVQATAPVVWIETIDPATSEPYSSGVVVPGKFLISRSGPMNGPLRVFLQYGGTAGNSVDYRQMPSSIEIPAVWPFAAVLDVVALPDTLVEGKETVEVTLLPAAAQEYRVDPNRQSGRVIIFDRQTPLVLPTLSIEATEPETRECALNEFCPFLGGRLTIRRTGELDYPLPVYVAVEGTAVRGVDYGLVLPDPSQQGFSHYLTLPAGQGRWDLIVAPIDDVLAEGDETATLRLPELAIDTSQVFPPLDYIVDAGRASATVVIHDNDPLGIPLVSIEPVDTNAAETLISQSFVNTAHFRVSRKGRLDRELLVFLNLEQGSARQGVDYRLQGVETGSVVRIRAGEASATVSLIPLDDELYEGEEYAFFHLIAPPPGHDAYESDYPRSSIRITIQDNDPVTTRLEITSPRDGEHFQAGAVIPLRSQIIGPGGNSDSWSVEFFDGDQLIGTTRLGGTIWWNNAIGGPHLINARAYNPAGVPGQDILVAPPVSISVGPGPAWPVVRIGAGRGQTLEPCPACFSVPAVFTISRTGPTHEALNVYLEYDGPAKPGVDYQALPHRVTIPPGTNAAHVSVMAIDDQLVEGPEIVRATIVTPELATLGYVVSYYASEAMVVINDDESGAPEIRLDIVEPDDGAQFAPGTTIEISALGVWTRGEVDRPVEFFAGNALIGRSNPPQLGRPTIPGLPSVHTILWTNPPSGRHALTARFERAPGLSITSPPVNITVGPEPTLPIIAFETLTVETREPITDGTFFIPLVPIKRTGASPDLILHFEISGTATEGTDYLELARQILYPAAASGLGLNIHALVDLIRETDETIVIKLVQPELGSSGYRIDPQRDTVVVTIHDSPPLPVPIVSMSAIRTETTEPSSRLSPKSAPGLFRISRSAPFEQELEVHLTYRGTAKSGEDYLPLPGAVVIPAGSNSLDLQVVARRDLLAEGDETVEAQLDRDRFFIVFPRYLVDPDHALDRVVIHDRPPVTPLISITRPASGTDFPPDMPIEIVTDTRDPDGYVRRVEFLADGRKIGEANVEFIRPPDPGQSQTFTFVWRQPSPGAHMLTARATDDEGTTGVSAPVSITVARSETLPIVTVIAPDPFAVEPRSNSVLNIATFRIRRFGPTNEPLVVAYSLRGTAGNGSDYERLTGLAIIPAGHRSASVIIRPLPDNLNEGLETVLLSLEQPQPQPGVPVSHSYRLGRPRNAVGLISDGPWSHTPGVARCLSLPGGLVHLCFAAQAGHNFRVESTDDFRNWQTLFDAFADEDGWHFIDADMAEHPHRFYRLRPEPVVEPDE